MISTYLFRLRRLSRKLWVRAVLISLLAVVAAAIAPLRQCSEPCSHETVHSAHARARRRFGRRSQCRVGHRPRRGRRGRV